jgi:hypothetical protein
VGGGLLALLMELLPTNPKRDVIEGWHGVHQVHQGDYYYLASPEEEEMEVASPEERRERRKARERETA